MARDLWPSLRAIHAQARQDRIDPRRVGASHRSRARRDAGGGAPPPRCLRSDEASPLCVLGGETFRGRDMPGLEVEPIFGSIARCTRGLLCSNGPLEDVGGGLPAKAMAAMGTVASRWWECNAKEAQVGFVESPLAWPTCSFTKNGASASRPAAVSYLLPQRLVPSTSQSDPLGFIARLL